MGTFNSSLHPSACGMIGFLRHHFATVPGAYGGGSVRTHCTDHLFLRNVLLCRTARIAASARGNGAIERHSKHETGEAVAGVTQHTVIANLVFLLLSRKNAL